MAFSPQTGLAYIPALNVPGYYHQDASYAYKPGFQNTGIEARLILCTLRYYSTDQSLETVRLVEEFRGTYVAAFDIAADKPFQLPFIGRDVHPDLSLVQPHRVSCQLELGVVPKKDPGTVGESNQRSGARIQ